MDAKRVQLSLFIDENDSIQIEKIRSRYNPEQYNLIKSHVTLCREDELVEIDKVLANLENLNKECITIDFGKIVRFSDGKGVLIPALGNNELFQDLRKAILKGIIEKPRTHEPHITLMHPRNSTCTDAIFKEIEKHEFPSKISFNKIAFIEQVVGMKWHILKEFQLKNRINR